MFEELHPDICAVVQGRRACCGSFGVCGREVRVLSPWWEEIRWVLSKNPNDPNDFPNDLQSLPSAGLLASERIPGARKFERALDARGERPGVQWVFTTNQVGDNQGGYQDQTSLIELVTLVGLDGLLSRCGGLDGRLDQVRCGESIHNSAGMGSGPFSWGTSTAAVGANPPPETFPCSSRRGNEVRDVHARVFNFAVR